MGYPLPEAGIALCLFLIGAGCYFYLDTKLKNAQKDYEIEFLNHHHVEDNIREYSKSFNIHFVI